MRKSIGLLVSALALAASPAGATTLTFNDFSNISGLQLNGSTAQVSNALRLTPATTGQAGSAFSLSPITLSNAYSFSTFFTFRISSVPNTFGDADGPGADGLTFIVQTVSNTAGGGGGGLGYQGLTNSMAVEYDTYNNGGIDGNNGNHVGVDLGGDVNSVARANVAQRMNDSNIWYSWIDYDGSTNLLSVRLALNNVRPASALLTHTFDLGAAIGSSNAFVGFSAGTGAGFGNHDILSWEFRDTFDPIDSVPEPATLSLLGLGLIGVAAKLRRRRA